VLAKPSRHAVHTTAVMKRIIAEVFNPDHVAIVEGGNEINQHLLEQPFDYIFFTGSTKVGRKIMETASRNLTPFSLELGGKSPVIVEPDSDPVIAAKRIMWGKLLNAGQSCVAPDYLLVHQDIFEKLVLEMKNYLQRVYGDGIKTSADYARIINESSTKKLASMMEGKDILIGGEADIEQKYISPTVIRVSDPDDILMQEEIFGPILPLVAYGDLDDALEIIGSKPRPLALYIFSSSRRVQQKIISATQSGSGGINETVVHFINPYLPFGGVGKSGIGRYHGKYSFESLSYKRSFLKKATWIDVPLRYPPYARKLRLIRWFIR
jgi:acyl-CoA reductase-like NAD-dependent aldehyde dehydrogenase